ncbi:hypothetical protein BTVI_83245 [Pitangus sulphuratus]|nr:hypothetical protein BTVI_83245 [Pitangus sulphuratus]
MLYWYKVLPICTSSTHHLASSGACEFKNRGFPVSPAGTQCCPAVPTCCHRKTHWFLEQAGKDVMGMMTGQQDVTLAQEGKKRPLCRATCCVAPQQEAGQRQPCRAAGMLDICTLQENMRKESCVQVSNTNLQQTFVRIIKDMFPAGSLGMSDRDSYFYAAIVAVVTVHVVLALFVYVAWNEGSRQWREGKQD